MEKLSQVPQIAMIIRDSPLFKSSAVLELTESETEYNVKCVKHCFTDYLILQFDCVNTLSEQLLEDVRVAVEAPEGYFLFCFFIIFCCLVKIFYIYTYDFLPTLQLHNRL